VISIKPSINLDFLKALTDDVGILQHAKYSILNRKEGYTTDDNARALIACMKFLQLHDNSNLNNLANKYLSFLFHMQRPDGKFHNFLSYDRNFLDEVGSEDCMGRSLWGCGYAILANLSNGINAASKEIFDKGFRHASNFNSPRAKALTILGLCNYYEAFPHDHNLSKNIVSLTQQLLDSYHRVSSSGWCWFEPYLTYINARLPQALFRAYGIIGDERYLQIAEESFHFLSVIQVIDEKFVPIGNKGWYKKNEKRALYDQQPIEASCTVETALTAFHVTNEEKYKGQQTLLLNGFQERTLKI